MQKHGKQVFDTHGSDMTAHSARAKKAKMRTKAEGNGGIERLNSRLNEPFVTVNTITGDTGIKKAQDEYEKLMKNKSPKSRR